MQGQAIISLFFSSPNIVRKLNRKIQKPSIIIPTLSLVLTRDSR